MDRRFCSSLNIFVHFHLVFFFFIFFLFFIFLYCHNSTKMIISQNSPLWMSLKNWIDFCFLSLVIFSSILLYDKEKFPESQEAIKLNIFIMFDIEKMTLNTKYVNPMTMYIIFSLTEMVFPPNPIHGTHTKCVCSNWFRHRVQCSMDNA